MKSSSADRFLFEKMSVPRAVFTLALPTILSQLVTMIYNLADTFFIGQLGSPAMVASVSIVYPYFNLLTAIGNLFGIGGSSLVSRFLGSGRRDEIKRVASFSFWAGIIFTLLFSLFSYLLSDEVLLLLGASSSSLSYAKSYLFYTVVIGGIPTMSAMTLSHLLRGEGRSKEAGIGMMLGGLLNIALDPIFIFIFGMGVKGAALATLLSNIFSLFYFLFVLYSLRKNTCVHISPLDFTFSYTKDIFSVGIASFLATTLSNLSNMAIVKLASLYGDIPVAAYGIVKKVDMLPTNICMGLCQGFMPLVGYNYAAGNIKRMHKVSLFSWMSAFILSALFALVYILFANGVLHIFIKEPETASLGATFLRIASLALPFTAINFLVSYTLQAMGKGIESAVITISRQGIFTIPLLILINYLFGLYGMIWVQLIVELLMLPISLGIYAHTLKKTKKKYA